MSEQLKNLLRDACASLLATARLTAFGRRRADLLILMFHRVLPEELRRDYPLPGLAVTPEALRWVLESLLPHFEAGTVSDLARRQAQGGSGRPLLAISFDDGQWDNLEFAAPVLQRCGVPATFYVPTDFMGGAALLWHDRAAWAFAALGPAERSRLLGRLGARAADPGDAVCFLEALKRVPAAERAGIVDDLAPAAPAPPAWARLMQWSEVSALHAAGHEIGSHACSHGLLPQMPEASQRRELADSRGAITAATGIVPDSLCYPNGSYDACSRRLAAECGYRNAVTTTWGSNEPDRDRYALRRCDMDMRRLVDRRGRLSVERMAMRLAPFRQGRDT